MGGARMLQGTPGSWMSYSDYREVNPTRVYPAVTTAAPAPPEPVWRATKRQMDNLVITPCEPIPMRRSNVRVQWEPSSYTEENERKNIFFELNDESVRGLLEAQEEKLKQECGAASSCLAKQSLIKCRINFKRVNVFDKDRKTPLPRPKPGAGGA